jgi:hypothetical protein
MHIHLAILNTGWLRWELSQAITLMLLNRPRDMHVTLDYGSWGRSIPSARNLARKKALALGADFLVMCDSDTWPIQPITPESNPLRLAELDLDYVGLPVLLWRPGMPEPAVVLNVTPLDNATTFDTSSGGLREVRRIGGGFLVVARRVLEKIKFRYEWDEDGIYQADEDMLFCDDARKAGFKVWAACDWLLGHVKEIDLVTVHEEIARQHQVLVQEKADDALES